MSLTILWKGSSGQRVRLWTTQGTNLVVGIYIDVGLDAEVPLVALLGLLRLRVGLTVGALGRATRRTRGIQACLAAPLPSPVLTE